ncbi:hypothetical protein CLV46_1658 [Diaminobutyricimonas aerilata]|uniref:Uncharacterized protein n=1 Tax=Diaminobutyricimonas aerilata TaxID=1162967 RepID=A0A2M9CJN0_9MICO|nr:hypothetical protein [Diaminobutyricimonas aerilata]PJJ72095.1 hypothetical protein CLV46_1658 [Diaminobutyricimonas aerilata]
MQHDVDGSAGDPPIRRRSNYRPPPEGFRYPFTDGVPGDTPRSDTDADATEPTPEWPAAPEVHTPPVAPDPAPAPVRDTHIAPTAAEAAAATGAASTGTPGEPPIAASSPIAPGAAPSPEAPVVDSAAPSASGPDESSTLDRIEWLQAELARRSLESPATAEPQPPAGPTAPTASVPPAPAAEPISPFGPRFIDPSEEQQAAPAAGEPTPAPSYISDPAPLPIEPAWTLEPAPATDAAPDEPATRRLEAIDETSAPSVPVEAESVAGATATDDADEPDPFEELLALVGGGDDREPGASVETPITGDAPAATPDPFDALLSGSTPAVDGHHGAEAENDGEPEGRRGLRGWFGRGRRE